MMVIMWVAIKVPYQGNWRVIHTLVREGEGGSRKMAR